MILLLLVVLVVLVGCLIWNIDSAMTPVIVLPILFVAAMLCFALYQNPDGPMELWNGIQSAPAAVGDYLKASLNELLDGMRAWGWIGFGLTGLFSLAVILPIGWFSGRALNRIEVNRAKAQTAAAERQAADERKKTREAERAAAQDREASEKAERLRFGSERRAQGLQGQLDQAVMLADSRGRENKGLRADKKKLQAEVAELRAQLPAGQQKAIVTPFVRERRGSTKRGTRTGP